MTAPAPLPIDLAEPDPAPAGDPWPRHLCMPSVEWPAPVGPVLRPDRPRPPAAVTLPWSAVSAASTLPTPTMTPAARISARFALLFAVLLCVYLAALVAALVAGMPVAAVGVGFSSLITALALRSSLRDCGVRLMVSRFPRERCWGFESYCAGSCALNVGTVEVALHYPAEWARWLVPALRFAGWAVLWLAVMVVAFALGWAVVTLGGPA